MYAIYRRDVYHYDQPKLIAICRTKMGAKKACRHFHHCYFAENNAPCEVTFTQVDPYSNVRLYYMILRFVRFCEQKKLQRLQAEENVCRLAREQQERKVASLY